MEAAKRSAEAASRRLKKEYARREREAAQAAAEAVIDPPQQGEGPHGQPQQDLPRSRSLTPPQPPPLIDNPFAQLVEHNPINIMVDYDTENGQDTAGSETKEIKVAYNAQEQELWFMLLENRMEEVGIKSQWTKRQALIRNLPNEVIPEI